jgi:hypothetical protein
MSEVTFDFRKVRSKTDQGGHFAELYYGEGRLCKVETWLFASCAVHGFKYMIGLVPWTTKLIDDLIVWLQTDEAKEQVENGWPFREVLFCITQGQQTFCKALINHSNVKQIDTFTNKAHGGTRMFLYRLSIAKDFS